MKRIPLLLLLGLLVFATWPARGQALKTASDYLFRAIEQREKGNLDAAINDFSKGIELEPRNLAAYFGRGHVRATKGDLAGAIADYSKAIELNSEDADSYYARANARHDKGDLDGAIADYSKAIEFNANNANAYYGRARVRPARGDPEGAIADYSKAIELNPLRQATLKRRLNGRRRPCRFPSLIRWPEKTRANACSSTANENLTGRSKDCKLRIADCGFEERMRKVFREFFKSEIRIPQSEGLSDPGLRTTLAL